MTTMIAFGGLVASPVAVTYPNTEIGPHPVGPVSRGRQRLATDAIGTATITFDGLPAGVEIHIYLPDGVGGVAGTELAGTESGIANQVLSWNVYAPGNPYNNVWITLVKRGLRFQKFQYTSKQGNQTLPIFMQSDLGYNNPA